MKICFYSPYLPGHFGGGEKHLFDVALAAAEEHQVFIGIPREKLDGSKTISQLRQAYQKFMGLDLSKLSFIETPLGSSQPAISKLLWTCRYDAIYYVTDGSLFFSLADHNFLHIQVPFTNHLNNPINKLKLNIWEHKNTNSQFTKKIVEQSWHTHIDMVLNPMIDIDEFSQAAKKKKVILNVGRFFRQLHSKRQDVLIEMFKQLCNDHTSVKRNWQLILVGPIEDKKWVDSLKRMAKGYPIKFKFDVDRVELIDLYLEAKIYWHAAGFGADERVNPQQVEHFGISTAEAMAAGCVPLTYLAGGQPEVLGSDNLHLGWKTKQDCLTKTWELMQDNKTWLKQSSAVRERAKQFDKRRFAKKVHKLFNVDVL